MCTGVSICHIGRRCRALASHARSCYLRRRPWDKAGGPQARSPHTVRSAVPDEPLLGCGFDRGAALVQVGILTTLNTTPQYLSVGLAHASERETS